MIVDFVLAMSGAKLAPSDTHSIVGSEKTTLDHTQIQSNNSGYGSSTYTHESSYSSAFLLFLVPSHGTILLSVSTKLCGLTGYLY